MSIAGNTAKVQEALLKKYSVEIVQDWMLDTSEDFRAKHSAQLENEIKAYLKTEFPQYADSDLLAEE